MTTPVSSPSRTKAKRIAAGVVLGLVIISWGVWEIRKRLSYAADLKDRPWAYTDTGAKLLVGKWHGTFTDPAGIEKQLTVEIVEPLTEEERTKKLKKRARDRGGPKPSENKHSFDGTARVTGKTGSEAYEIYGAVDKSDYHQLHFSFRIQDETKRILLNYAPREARPANWKDDTLTLSLQFNNYKADGAATSTSEGEVVDGKMVWKESPDEKPVPVFLTRM